MLPRAHRLRRSLDYRRLYQSGRSAAGRHLALRFQRHTIVQPTRIGVVVGSKVSKRATVRNRLRRQLRELMRARLRQRPHGYTLAVIARPGAATTPLGRLQEEIDSLMRRLPPQP